MKKRIANRLYSPLSYVALAALLAAGLAVAAFLQSPQVAPRALAALTPAGPLLVLQAPDFATLVRDWDGSPEKRLWLQSANFQEFSRSRLYLRLEDALGEFGDAAGIPADMDLVRSVAGGDSLLALYDIGKLEFLYMTRMPAARSAATLLWKTRSKFEPRDASGAAYYVSVDKQSGRTVAFAAAGGLLLLTTREDLLSGALTMLAGKSLAAVTGEQWYSESVRAAARPGDLRMVMNLEALARSPHFRSYWIQRNVPELRAFTAGVSDLFRSPTEIREERVFLRAGQPAQAATPAGSVDPLLALVPPDAGLYRAWAAPSADSAVDLLARKMLAPRAGAGVPTRSAPRVSLSGGEVGTEADLETMIDEPPPDNASAIFVPGPLRSIVEKAGLQGMLQLQSTRAAPGGVFVGTESAVVLLGSSGWDSQAVRGALVAAVEGLWSRTQLGLNWVEKKQGSRAWHALGGLAALAVAADGRYLVVANSDTLLAAVLDRLKPGTAAPSPTSYAAGFRHAREKANYAELMRALDQVAGARASAAMPEPQTPEAADEADAAAAAPGQPGAPGAAPARPPHFFSENLGSLSEALARVESASIVVRENGASISETVLYRLSK